MVVGEGIGNLGGIVKYGTFSAAGGGTVFNIAHGMSPQPDYVIVGANSSAAAHNAGVPLTFFWVWDATNITVTFNAATPAGTVSLHWIAGNKRSVRGEINAVLADAEED